jgi:hypothetical protein
MNGHRATTTEPEADLQVVLVALPVWELAMPLKLNPRFIMRPKRSPDLWQFSLSVQEVMTRRILQAMAGTLSDAEVRRMVMEKHAAGVRAQLAYTRSFFKSGPAAASHSVFDLYNRAVQSNRKRLRKRRPW